MASMRKKSESARRETREDATDVDGPKSKLTDEQQGIVMSVAGMTILVGCMAVLSADLNWLSRFDMEDRPAMLMESEPYFIAAVIIIVAVSVLLGCACVVLMKPKE